MYNTDALKNGILKCRDNIKIFEDAIEKERTTIKDYQSKIDILEEKERLEKIKDQHIEIERE